MEKTFLLYLSVHWEDLIEQIKKKSVIYTLRAFARLYRILSRRQFRTKYSVR